MVYGLWRHGFYEIHHPTNRKGIYTMSKNQRAELIERKLEQLHLYHDTLCPKKKLPLVERVIAKYESILDGLISNLKLSKITV